jgi:tRNA dimethylallyltransferase
MMEGGFLEEVHSLVARGYGPELKPMQSLGYKQMVRYLLGKCTHGEAVQEMQRETRRYAKRQMTWFRGDPDFRWFDVSCGKEILAWIKSSANIP